MAKVGDCTHMELYTIAYTDVELVGSKIILCMYLKDVKTEVVLKRVSISATNIPKFLKVNKVKSTLKLRGCIVECLINNLKEINYISLLGEEWTFCQDLHMRED